MVLNGAVILLNMKAHMPSLHNDIPSHFNMLIRGWKKLFFQQINIINNMIELYIVR